MNDFVKKLLEGTYLVDEEQPNLPPIPYRNDYVPQEQVEIPQQEIPQLQTELAPQMAQQAAPQAATQQPQQVEPQVEQLIEEPMPEEDTRLQDAYGERDDLRKKADLLRGFKSIGQALASGTGYKADMTMANELAKRAEDPVNKYKWDLKEDQMKQSMATADMKAKEMGIKLDQMGDLNNPKHKLASVLRANLQNRENKLAKSQNREVVQIDPGDNMSFYHLNLLDDIQDKNEKNGADWKHDMAWQRLLESQEKRKDRKENQELNRDLRIEKKLDRDVEAISKRLEKSDIMAQKGSFKIIDDYLTEQGGILGDKETYKNVSIPGMGVAGGMRPDFATPVEAVEFRQNVQSLANRLLKQRSGAAVTDQEYRRFLKEVGSGNFSNEANLMTGLAKMKQDLNDLEENIVKSADPKAQVEYKRRMGIASEPKSEIKRKTKDGKIAVFDSNKKFLRYEE